MRKWQRCTGHFGVGGTYLLHLLQLLLHRVEALHDLPPIDCGLQVTLHHLSRYEADVVAFLHHHVRLSRPCTDNTVSKRHRYVCTDPARITRCQNCTRTSVQTLHW